MLHYSDALSNTRMYILGSVLAKQTMIEAGYDPENPEDVESFFIYFFEDAKILKEVLNAEVKHLDDTLFILKPFINGILWKRFVGLMTKVFC